MPTRYPMNALDALYLKMERPEQTSMVDGAFLFADQVSMKDVRPVVMERMVERYPVMRRRPVQTDEGWFWEDDEAFDIDYHIFDARLRAPDVEAVRRYISRQRSTLLSRTHPLWQVHIIRNVSGLGDGKGSVVLFRWHHAIADGIRLVQVLLSMCDTTTEASVPNVARNLGQSTATSRLGVAAREVASGTSDLAGGVTDATAEMTARLAGAASEVGANAVEALSAPGETVRKAPARVAGLVTDGGAMLSSLLGKGAEAVTRPGRLVNAAVALTAPDNRVANTLGASVKLTLPAPTAKRVWTGKVGAVKEAYWSAPIPLADIATARAANPASSVNDVLLTILASALSRYLREHGDHSDGTTGWFIPASIKPLDENLPRELGNHFVGLVADLPVGVDDPKELLSQVTERMARIKNSDEAFLAFGLQEVLISLPDSLADTLMASLFEKVNGSLVSVPGPRAPVSLGGHEVTSVLAFGPATGEAPIVATLFTYNDSVVAALTLDRTLLPDSSRIPELIDEEAGRVMSALSTP
jgi:diacylglycerol O-acyltransferase